MTDEPVRFTEGPHGFAWGAAEVVRIAEIDGRVVLGVKTDAGRELHVYVSRSGRSVRVFEPYRSGEWGPVDKSKP